MTRLRRFIWYLASRLALLIVLLGLFTVTFYYAMNATNVYIVLKDGMAKRAQVIMMGEEPTELNKFFQSSYLQRDENLIQAIDGQSPYLCYTVRGIDHRLNRAYADTARQLFGETYETPPKWQAGRYSATLVKENNQWHIKGITLREALTE